MKRIATATISAFAIAASIFICSCDSDEPVDPTPATNPTDDDPNTPSGGNTLAPNEVSDRLILAGTPQTGSIPAATKQADLLLDKDTIFMVEGIRTRIRIRNDGGLTGKAGAVYVQVTGADEYFILEPEEESTDTVSVLYLEIDPADWALPASFKLKIAPTDEAGNVVKEIDREVVIEKKGTACSPWGHNDDESLWRWIYTLRNNELELMEATPQPFAGTVNGCCLDGYTVNCIANGMSSNASLAYEGYYMIPYEYVRFFSSGTFAGELERATRNYDPINSNFCTSTAAYRDDLVYNTFWGDYVFNESTNIIDITKIEGQIDQVDVYGTIYDVARPVFLTVEHNLEMISCHFMVERKTIEGTGEERYFERTPSGWFN